ncbi:54S ribosomal protein L12, mitochondrial [Schizosaccharomyces pombe]
MFRIASRQTRNLRALSSSKNWARSLVNTRSFRAAASVQNNNAQIGELVDKISSLSLLETSELVKQLKEKLNIAEIAPMAAVAPAVASAAPSEEKAPEEKKEEKTTWNLKLESFDAGSKAKVIKEVKSLLGLSLVDAKKFVESAPKVLKENILKEDAEAIKSKLEKLSCKVVLE